MCQMRDLIGPQRAAAAGVIRPAEDAGLEESAIDDYLTAALEQIEQTDPALGSVELVLLFYGQPRHPSAFRGQRVAGAGEGLLFHEEFLTRGLPLLLRDDGRRFHREIPFDGFLVSLLACFHVTSPFLSPTFCPQQCTTSPSICSGLRHEGGELAFERFAYAGAPGFRDGLGRGIGEDFLFTFFQAVEDASSRGFRRDFRYVEAAVHVGVHGTQDDGMDRYALANQERSQ